MATLIAEDLLLLLLDDDKGRTPSSTPTSTVLGGALLIELSLAGAVEVEKTKKWASAKVYPVDGPDAWVPEDHLLAEALAIIAEKPRAAQDLVDRLGKGAQEKLSERLADRGILERRQDKMLGLFPRTRWPATDTAHETELRRALTASLVQGTMPDDRTSALIGLLLSIGRAHKTVEHRGLTAREVKARAKEIAEGAWAAKAVRDAVAASMAATTAVIAASSASTTAAGSS